MDRPVILPLKQRSGFTLVELLAVLIIVAILAAVSAPIYIQYVKGARAADAQTTMSAILTAEKVQFQKFGSYAPIEDLDVMIDEATRAKWVFEVVQSGHSLSSIKATSTEQMPGGSGKEITYDVRTGSFSGYGIDD